VRSNGIELAYETFGDPNSQPLLLIMGLGCQMLQWDEPFCVQLAARGYRVIRFDNRDVGESSWCTQFGTPNVPLIFGQALAGRPVSAPYTLADMAQDTVGLLDALEIESAHVVGASMGGAIAQEVALRHRRRVRTLTSIMSTSGDPKLPPPTPAAMAVLLSPTPTEYTAYIERYARVWKLLRGAGYAEDEALDLERAVRLHGRGINPAGVARQLAAILASGSRKERLASLRVPTFVIHGDADPLVPVACGIDVARSVPHARLEVVEGMGHALPIRLWPRIVEAISDHAVWT
jgi:pimeloyl-ACP methyl ester carboxylesterase